MEIPNSKLNELLILINVANQNSEEGFFVFDFKFWNLVIDAPISGEISKNNLSFVNAINGIKVF